MSAKYETGRPYMATVNGEPNRRVVQDPNGDWFTCDEGELVWGGTAITEPVDLSDVRPLVVLDLTPDETEATLHVLGDAACDFENNGAVHSLAVINRLRDQIREQSRPPKPAEPQGLGAVVEDSEGRRWVRGDNDHCCWFGAHKDDWFAYRHIDAVRVLSEGVQP